MLWGTAGGEQEWCWASSEEGEGGRMGGIEEGEVDAGIGEKRGGSLHWCRGGNAWPNINVLPQLSQKKREDKMLLMI